ncbi:unnamed protein product [Ceutorhynchus assimilis]|uniref:Solute carrier family 25 member 51 n=1 Tax=Ceutorhynchus assimilis TaxID=467358 RepID=A0A9N9MN49_9CUCU|nr:unnamed protein product [Ceutorhynchus assimilis]
MSQNDPTNKQTPIRVEFISGLGSAILNIGITYPVTKLIYRQILENQRAVNSLQIIRKEGLWILYRGAIPPMLQRCVTLSTMFAVYKAASLPLEHVKMGKYYKKISACFIAGTLESVFMPLERIQILLVSSKYNKRFRNMFHLTAVIARDYHVKEFYRGYTLILLRNVTANSCFFITKDELNKRYGIDNTTNTKSFAGNIQQFIFGSLIGTFMTILFYPLKVMKVNIHQNLGGRFRGLTEIAQDVYRKDGGGIANFYRGIIINSFRSLFAWGITNVSYEYIKEKLNS